MLSDIAYRLRALFRGKAVEQELDDEIRFHLARQVDKYVAIGLGRDEALRRARLAFGATDRVAENAAMRAGSRGWSRPARTCATPRAC
jgi:hypothetical protein